MSNKNPLDIPDEDFDPTVGVLEDGLSFERQPGWQSILRKRFPTLYRTNYQYPLKHRVMHFSCHKGWFNLLWELSIAIEKELNYSWFTKLFAVPIDRLIERNNIFFRKLWYKISGRNTGFFGKQMGFCYFKLSVFQVKEKFGTLRYYYSFDKKVSKEAKDRIAKLVATAEKLSGVTCDVCGEEGTLFSKDMPVRTRCEQHKDWFWLNDRYNKDRRLASKQRNKARRLYNLALETDKPKN